jgi:hypothetical protein
MPINEMVLTVAVMTFAFLGEVAVFAFLEFSKPDDTTGATPGGAPPLP